MAADRFANRRATDLAEHDEAARVIQWLRGRAIKAREAGNGYRGAMISVACSSLESAFLLPVEPVDSKDGE